MPSRSKLSEYLHQKKWFFLALALTLLAAWICFTYIGMTQTPIGGLNISPAAQPGAWTYTLADGTEIAPDEAGNFSLPSADAVVYCTRSLAEYENELTASALLAVNTRSCDVAVFADGELLADPTHRFDEEHGTFAETSGKGTNGGLFTLGIASELTVAVRFLTENTSVSSLPSVEIFFEGHAYYSQWMSAAAESALPAGVFLAATLLLTGLFLFQLYDQKCNWEALLLALVALTFCLLNTVPYGVYVIWFLQTPLLTFTLRLLPTLMILWILWHHSTGKMRRFGWLLPLLCTAGVILGIIWRLIDTIAGNRWTNLLQGTLLPLAMLLALLCCGWQAYRKNGYFHRFFRWGGCLAVCIGVLTLISFLRQGDWWLSLSAAFQNIALLGFFAPMQQLNYLLLLLFFLLAIYDCIWYIVRSDQKVQMLTLQNRYAVEHAAHLSRSLDETHALRHEMRHHIEVLKALCREGNIQRLSDYVENIGGKISDAPGRYTDHALVNALVSSCAEQAKRLAADFEAVVWLPEQIAIDDTDLAVLLSNMIDNALEALAAIPDAEDRLMRLKVEIFEDTGLFVSCANSFAGELKRGEHRELLSTKAGEGHGFGLKAMHRVAEKYGSVLVVEQEKDMFSVKTYLYFKQK